MKWIALAIAAAVPTLPAEPAAERVTAYEAAVHLARDIGSRPAASRTELRAQRYVERRFARAGLETRITRFRVPGRGRGRSRNVIGIHDTPRRCLKIAMAHIDSVPAGPGAVDNASGVGVLVAIAGRLERLAPRCDVWLVATGAEERPYTGQPDHLGSTRLVRHVRSEGRARSLRYALSIDMVGRGRRFQLRSPRGGPRRGIERQLFAAGRSAGVPLRWRRDSGTGNSDHREFELAGMPGLVMQLWRGLEPCWHEGCDTWRRLKPRSLRRARRVVESALLRP
ncbi:MAG TPA: M28 family peptidase [Thermoleophilaceae bacterium]|nr:M28 family peptidase [Thermoleophilaceae bacterium]